MNKRQVALLGVFTILSSMTSWSSGCGSGTSTPPESTLLPILFVSDRDEPGNWDIYSLDLTTGVITRLTTDPAIDNHPDLSHDGTRVLFTTTRFAGNDFDLAIASDVNNVDGTAVRLTDDSIPNGPQTHYPDRHPHFSHDGELVVFSAKNRAVVVTLPAVQSECCVPIITHELRYYENLCVLRPATGDHVVLDPKDGLDASGPNIWFVPDPAFSDDPVYVGHPTFSDDSDRILFSASVDGEGAVWNVFSVGFDPGTLAITPNSLRRHTLGSNYPMTPNPIQLSGGAHYSPDESVIFFSSTRTDLGNSQLFWTPATATDTPVDANRLVSANAGNDYLPEPLDDGRIVFVSDLGPVTICGEPGEGPSPDLDLFIINPDGTLRVNVTDNDAADEVLLIGDEVSWFCGLKPNLTSCTKMPRVFDTEALWLTRDAGLWIPDDLLDPFGRDDAKAAYTAHWNNLQEYVGAHPHLAPQWQQIQNDTNQLGASFPGFVDHVLLSNWLDATADVRARLYVLPSFMRNEGIGSHP